MVVSIRPEQMAAFASAASVQFEAALLDYAREFHGQAVDRYGEDAAREAIREGIARAAGYGITERRHVCLFIDVLFTCGRDFDVRLEWAAEILRDRTLTAAERIDELFERAGD
jgi:hypothetical protein